MVSLCLFDINCGMGGASFGLNDSGQLLLQNLFISHQLWVFLLGSEHSTPLTLGTINWRGSCRICYSWSSVGWNRAGISHLSLLTLEKRADAGLVHKSCCTKALRLLMGWLSNQAPIISIPSTTAGFKKISQPSQVKQLVSTHPEEYAYSCWAQLKELL